MTQTPPAHDGRSRHWAVDAAIGASLALGLITAAKAALPRAPPAAPASPAAARFISRPAAAAPEPVLIRFQEPLPGFPVISPFGLRQLPWEEGGRLHAGVDIAAPAGLPVLAAADGVVTRVEVDGGYGRFVEVKHAAGLLSRYAHLSRALPQIAPGVAVKAGSPLGEIGSTGSSTGAHLHFEIRDAQDRPLNPELFLDHSFARTADLPLRAALRIPRTVRVAYVSNIPKTKLAQMEAKAEQELQLRAADAAADASSAEGQEIAANAADSGVDADARISTRLLHGRPHGRFVSRN